MAIRIRHPQMKRVSWWAMPANGRIFGPNQSSNTLESARDYAHYIVGEYGIPAAITYHEWCARCDGTGKVRRPRSKMLYATIPCKACAGSGANHQEDVEIVER
jgi:hypothetical protein